MLTIYIYNCTFCIKMIMIGIKCELQEQLQYRKWGKIHWVKLLQFLRVVFIRVLRKFPVNT